MSDRVYRWAETGRCAPIETPATLLRDAADLLRHDGWTQGTAYDDGRRCALGAVLRLERSYSIDFLGGVVRSDPVIHGAVAALAGLVRESRRFAAFVGMDLDVSTVVQWNDYVCFGAEDCAQGMEKAAAWWEEKNGA